MSVTIEPLVTVSGDVKAWTCRSGPSHDQLGDPYVTVCTISRQDGSMAFVTALAGPELAKSEVEELKGLLRKQGCTSIAWKRIRADGTEHYAIVSLAR